MHKLKELLDNSAIRKCISLLSTDVLVRGANFLLIPVFLHLMTKNDFGVYGYLYNFAMSCSLILNLGYHVALPKLYVQTSEDKQSNSSMLFTLTTLLFSFVCSVFLLFYLTDLDFKFFNIVNKGENAQFDYTTYRPYLFVATASMIFSNFLTYYFISSKKIKNIQFFNLIRLFLCNGTAILVLYLSKDTDTVMLRLCCTYLSELLLCILFFGGVIRQMRAVFCRNYVTKALKIGLPICSVALINTFINFGDKQFVMMYCGNETMGAYNLATTLATIPLIVFQSFNFVWLPDFLAEKDLATLNRKTNRNAKLVFLVLLGVSLVVWIGTYFLLLWGVFPQNYKEIISFLPILLLSQIFASMILYYFNSFTYFEKTYIPMIVSIVSAALSYVLYSVLGKAFGVMGIATALTAINLLVATSYMLLSKRYIKRARQFLSD